MVALAAVGQVGTTAPSNGPQVDAVVDANGNLHVPDSYRSTYEFLGSWAVASDQDRGSRSCMLSTHRQEPSPPIARTDVSLTTRCS